MAKVKISLILEKGDTLDSLKSLGLPIIDAHILKKELVALLASIIENNDKISGELNSSAGEGEVVASVTYHDVII